MAEDLMTTRFQAKGLEYLRAPAERREAMTCAWESDAARQEVLAGLEGSGHSVACREDLLGEMAFLAMVARWFEPRDLCFLIGGVCEHARRLADDVVQEVLAEVEPLLDDESKGTNLGCTSTRRLFRAQVEAELESRRQR